MGFYEPLHEDAARWRRRDVIAMRPGAWHSNHGETAPYFLEYRDLIPPRGGGVAGYQPRFAFDAFFRAAADPPDAALAAYLRRLLAAGAAEQRVPVLKFCRSLGRVGWLEQQFPDALHLIVLRDPAAQFASARRLLEQRRNRYFMVAPLLVLVRNSHHPVVRDATLALDIRLPALFSDDFSYGMETSWRHIRRQTPQQQYRIFLAFWTLCAVFAVASDAPVLALGGPAGESADAAQAALRIALGRPVDLALRAGAETPAPWMEDIHRDAAAFACAQSGWCPPHRLAQVVARLAGERSAAGRPRATPMPPPPPPRGFGSRIATAAEVAYARALQPVRRLHGAISLRLSLPERP